MALRRTSPKITHSPFQSFLPLLRRPSRPSPLQASPIQRRAGPHHRSSAVKRPEKVQKSSAAAAALIQFQFAGCCSDCPNTSPIQFQHLRPRQQQLQHMHRKSLTEGYTILKICVLRCGRRNVWPEGCPAAKRAPPRSPPVLCSLPSPKFSEPVGMSPSHPIPSHPIRPQPMPSLSHSNVTRYSSLILQPVACKSAAGLSLVGQLGLEPARCTIAPALDIPQSGIRTP
jgi:hypothetical protein